MGRPRKNPEKKIYRAKESFSTELDGSPVIITAGRTLVAAGHPLLLGREGMFEELHVDYDVEAATAAPGEKRGA